MKSSTGKQSHVCRERRIRQLLAWLVLVGVVCGFLPSKIVGASKGGSGYDAAPSLRRISSDRPGPNVWDVKVLYATFKSGPDEKRDTNGQLTRIATEINGYFERQRPGFKLRFDTFANKLDIQHIALPITNQEFRALFTESGDELQAFFQRAFADAGIPFSWNGPGRSEYGLEKRMYVMFMEGSRGIKYGFKKAEEYQCGRVSEFEAGARIIGVNIRDDLGRTCQNFRGFEKDPSRWWEAAWDVARFLAFSLSELPGCGSVMQEEIHRAVDQRLENIVSTRDVRSNKWMIPRRVSEEPILDVSRTKYFRISSGPHVGDRCRDIQFSPFWQELPTERQKPGAPSGRSLFDRPDETADPRLKVFYVVPKDGVDRRVDVGLTPMMTTLDSWMVQQTGQRFRWDTFRGQLDTTFVRLDETEAQLWQSDHPVLECWEISCPSGSYLYGKLQSRGLVQDSEIAVILYDAKQSPVQPRPSGCYAGSRYIVGYSMCIGSPYETKQTPNSQSTLGLRIAHEVFHTLGAVPERAPNNDSGHIRGDTNDIMSIGNRTGWDIDPGRDDYWGHGRIDLTDISRSVFLVPPKPDAEYPPNWKR